jgi:hypothetical protein
MRIYIPSHARADRQRTFESLPPSLRENATIVVYPEEASAYCNFPVTIAKVSERGIGHKRKWIVDNHDIQNLGPEIVMLDDDLGFLLRRKDDPSKFIAASPKEVEKMFTTIYRKLSKYAQVGICPREGGNNMLYDAECTRIQRVIGCNVAMLLEAETDYSRLPVMEDFDVSLQLLRAGYKNCVLAHWGQQQGASNAPGGCSTYRTMEVQKRGALGLKALHPEFVTVVVKQTKTAWGGQERTDVRIQWKKAYASSCS